MKQHSTKEKYLLYSIIMHHFSINTVEVIP